MYIKKITTTIPLLIILIAIISLIISNHVTLSTFAQNTSLGSPSYLSTPPPPPPPFSNQLSAQQMTSSTNKTCTLTPSLIEVEGTPQQTEGPYFVAGMPNRSDIKSDPSDSSIQDGIPLDLVINVYSVDDKGDNNTNVCSPLSGARVDIWHVNSQGQYSGVQQDGTGGKMYLRGYQITDDNGTANFDTIYPGWYEGRAIHLHVKVSTFDGPNEKSEWTSQFYLNDTISEDVHKQLPYSKHGLPSMTNEKDGIYTRPSTDGLIQSNTGQHLMLNITKNKQGYNGTFNTIIDATNTEK